MEIVLCIIIENKLLMMMKIMEQVRKEDDAYLHQESIE